MILILLELKTTVGRFPNCGKYCDIFVCAAVSAFYQPTYPCPRIISFLFQPTYLCLRGIYLFLYSFKIDRNREVCCRWTHFPSAGNGCRQRRLVEQQDFLVNCQMFESAYNNSEQQTTKLSLRGPILS